MLVSKYPPKHDKAKKKSSCKVLVFNVRKELITLIVPRWLVNHILHIFSLRTIRKNLLRCILLLHNITSTLILAFLENHFVLINLVNSLKLPETMRDKKSLSYMMKIESKLSSWQKDLHTWSTIINNFEGYSRASKPT